MPSLATNKRQLRRACLATAVAALFGGGFAAGLQLNAIGDASGASAVPAAAAGRQPPPAPGPATPPPAATTTVAGVATESAPVTAADAARYLPLYRRAARRFGVNWLLIAAIHKQETAFSTAAGTYHGLNFAHCCAGPMQFNVKNGHPSTWERYRTGFTYAHRPASYPHATGHHPSVYDDFDSIMAAAWLLRSNGAGEKLDGTAWGAAYMYYGPGDVAAVDYANAVLARAMVWSRTGFAPNAADDPALIADLESAYGGAIRSQILAAAAAAAKDRRDARRKRRAAHERAARAQAHRRHTPRSSKSRRAPARRHHAAPARPHGNGSTAKSPDSVKPPDVHTSTAPIAPPPAAAPTPIAPAPPAPGSG